MGREEGEGSFSSKMTVSRDLIAFRQSERVRLDKRLRTFNLMMSLLLKKVSHPSRNPAALVNIPLPLPNRISRLRRTSRKNVAASPRRSPVSGRLPSTILEVETRMEGVAKAPPRASSFACSLYSSRPFVESRRLLRDHSLLVVPTSTWRKEGGRGSY